MDGRTWLDLVALVPGARGNPGTVRAGFAGSDVATYQVDGVDVSNTCCGGSNQAYSQRTSRSSRCAAIREFTSAKVYLSHRPANTGHDAPVAQLDRASGF